MVEEAADLRPRTFDSVGMITAMLHGWSDQGSIVARAVEDNTRFVFWVAAIIRARPAASAALQRSPLYET